jgi:conjugal transfer pilus assembly protein TraW
MSRAATPLLVAALLLVGGSAEAIDLGTLGPTYEIAEPHLLAFIEQRLREKERSGELQRLAEAARARGIDTVRQPPPVEGLRTTERPRTFYVDPSFTLDRNITDPQGRLMFAAGTRKNPLEVVSLSRHLLFFDARDPRQVKHARELNGRYAGRIKPILTGGSYLDLMKAWRVPVYYDQSGTLTRRFGIRQVPALVSQDGLRLRIDELGLP